MSPVMTFRFQPKSVCATDTSPPRPFTTIRSAASVLRSSSRICPGFTTSHPRGGGGGRAGGGGSRSALIFLVIMAILLFSSPPLELGRDAERERLRNRHVVVVVAGQHVPVLRRLGGPPPPARP